MIATVTQILNEQEVMLEIASGVNCKFIKSAIVNVFNGSEAGHISPTTPQKETPAPVTQSSIPPEKKGSIPPKKKTAPAPTRTSKTGKNQLISRKSATNKK
jgi:hypothetical protein